jgi:hypothetical protein
MTSRQDVKPIVITVSYFRNNLPEILHRVLLLKQKYILTKHGHAYVSIGPVQGSEKKAKKRK